MGVATSQALIVDHVDSSVEQLRTLLESTGWSVVTARHGAEALALARQHVPDLVISDLLMPVMDGYTLLRHWRADPRLRAVPFVVYAETYTDSEDERLVLSLGADAYIVEPSEPEELLARVRAVGSRPVGSPHPLDSDDPIQLRRYGESLIRKLEEKTLLLEQTNRQLERDIAARAAIEQTLRDREGRLNMLLELGDAIRESSNRDFLPEAMRIIGAQFGASHCAYVEVSNDDTITVVADHAPVGRSLAGVVAPGRQLSSLAQRLITSFRRGAGALVIGDIDKELSPGERSTLAPWNTKAFVCCPLVRGGTLRALLALGHSTTRAWTPTDVTFMREALERCTTMIERAAIESTLQRNEALLRIAGDVAHLGGWSVELPDRRVTWSDKMCEIHGLPIGTNPNREQAVAMYAPEFQELLTVRLDACISEGAPFELDAQIITPAGRRVWVRCLGVAERDASGKVVRIQGAVQDIDEARRLEEQLRQAQKMEAVGRLAGGIAHDFNNLLSVIMSYSAFLLEDVEHDDPKREDIEEIDRASRRAADLTRQLLAFSRHQVLQPRVLDLSEVVRSMERMLRRVLGEDIELALQLPGEPARVHADPTQLEQILMNLAVNARDAMPRGGRLAIRIRIAELEGDVVGGHVSVAPGPYVVLAVTDTGTGMDAATCERIFEPFFTTKEPGKGTGLGLSTVFAIVAKSGGVVVVESEPGRGTTFKVALPRSDAERTDLDAPAPAPPTLLGSETILLVEDDEQVRSIVRAILRRQGYTVLEASNGAEASLINEQHDGTIHLVLTDVIMPRMGGRELAEQIVARRPGTRVVYFSGYNEDAILQHGVLDSGIDFLQKPVTPEVLKRKIRDVLDRC